MLTACDSGIQRQVGPSLQTLRRRLNIFHRSCLRKLLEGHGFTNVIAIPQASVPIVKFFDPRTGLHVDLNCNNRLGLINTALLQAYCDLWAPLRLMIFFVKTWAKSWALNDPSGANGPASFSSYCLALMCVAYLQVRARLQDQREMVSHCLTLQSKGVLPNLQGRLSRNVDRERSGFWLMQKDGKRTWCDTRFQVPPTWNGTFMTLGNALYGWFR